MKDHTDRAGVRLLITAVSLCLFILVVWVPALTLWINPWLYDGLVFGSHEWRKAFVLSGWIFFAPFVFAFGYGFTTMFRAIRRDERDREESARAREVSYRNSTYTAEKLP